MDEDLPSNKVQFPLPNVRNEFYVRLLQQLNYQSVGWPPLRGCSWLPFQLSIYLCIFSSAGFANFGVIIERNKCVMLCLRRTPSLMLFWEFSNTFSIINIH